MNPAQLSQRATLSLPLFTAALASEWKSKLTRTRFAPLRPSAANACSASAGTAAVARGEARRAAGVGSAHGPSPPYGVRRARRAPHLRGGDGGAPAHAVAGQPPAA